MHHPRVVPRLLMLALACSVAAAEEVRPGLEWFAHADRAAQMTGEDALVAAVDAQRLAALHERLGSRPHRAGTPGDREVIDQLAATFASFGLDVEVQEIEVYLAEPVDAELELVGADGSRTTLPVSEPAIEGDPDTAHPELDIGWNAYSATGDVTAPVVYANRGTKEDFERLAALGVDCAGKIVLARYGGNFRGYKAKYAEAAGAVGLVIFTDPADAGFGKGLAYPEGGYAGPGSIQRGSILTLDYAGDPLTPFVPALADAEVERLVPAAVDLPAIPVQPVGWAAAEPILRAMRGPAVPDDAWQGGLAFRYRLTSGDDGPRVRLRVEQRRSLVRTANVVATMTGSERPEEFIVIGCHHDAWGFGASDPLSGLICVVEAARVLSDATVAGRLPRRSIKFAGWGAEEHGIIGSVEWVEANLDDLRANCVAYINLDAAATGPNLSASAWPGVARVAIDAARIVPQAGHDAEREGPLSAYDLWLARSGRDATEPAVGLLGGGSDHVGFLCHAGVPSIAFSARGAQGTAYHTNADTLRWYRQVVGEDYASARMVTQVTAVAASRMANAAVVPYENDRVYETCLDLLPGLAARAEAAGVPLDEVRLRQIFGRGPSFAGEWRDGQVHTPRWVGPYIVSRASLRSPRVWTPLKHGAWLSPKERRSPRPWYRNLFIAPDAMSGYASWPLHELRAGIESGDRGAIEAATARLDAALRPVFLLPSISPPPRPR